MDYTPYNRQGPTLNSDAFVLDKKAADVNGDGVIDEVYLTGTKPAGPDSIVIGDIKIVISDGKTDHKSQINLNVNKGYIPKIFLGRFTNNMVNDILVSIDSGNTGEEGYFYIYSFLNNRIKKLFDFEEFNKQYKYDVIYKDNYIVNITSGFSDKQFVVDISRKNADYLRQLYNPNGTLKKPMRGYVSPILELRPVVSEAENSYDLYATQRVVGYYNADTIGIMVTPLRYDGTKFSIIGRAPYLDVFEKGINIIK